MHIGLAVKTHMLSHGVASGLPMQDYIGEHSRHKGGQIAKDVLWAGMEMCVLWKRMNAPPVG